MKVLVTTRRTNGLVEGDYDWTVPGELAWVTMVCDRDLRDPEGSSCGCGRGFGGMTSHRATTTVEVADLAMSPRDLLVVTRTSLTDQGWLDSRQSPAENRDFLDMVIGDIRAVAQHFQVGEIVRRRIDEFYSGSALADG